MADMIALSYEIAPPDPTIRISPHSLGILAVEADLRRIDHEVMLVRNESVVSQPTASPEDIMVAKEAVAMARDAIGIYKNDIRSNLLVTRSIFGRMTREDKRLYDEHLDNYAPKFIRYLYGQWLQDLYQNCDLQEEPSTFDNRALNSPDGSWAAWLDSGASDDQLLNFVQWNSHDLEELRRNPDVASQVNFARIAYYAGVRQAVKHDKLHPDSLIKLREITQAPLLISDFVHMKVQQAVGYVIRTDPRKSITLAESKVRGGRRGFRKTFNHEKDHWLGIFNERWLDEWAAEHVAQSLIDEQWDNIHPDTHGASKSYPGCFSLGYEIFTQGRTTIPANILTRGFTKKGKNKYIEIDMALEKAYGLKGKDVRALIETHLWSTIQAEIDNGNNIWLATDKAAKELAMQWRDPKRRQEILATHTDRSIGVVAVAASVTKGL